MSKFRNLSKSTVGTIALFGFLIIIVASFALADLSNFNVGGGGDGSPTLAEVGEEEVTDRMMSDALQRQLGLVRQQNPEALYSDLAGDFDPILEALIDERALVAFANAYDFYVSKRLIDADISRLPGVAGLDGQVTEASYGAFLAQNNLTDAEVRLLIAADIRQRLMVAPVGAAQRVPTGMAQVYASMLLETRRGNIALVPTAPIAATLDPSAEEVATYYEQNKVRYTVPEQRVLRFARYDAATLEGIAASDEEIAAALEARAGEIGTRETRIISQVVVPDRETADEIVARTATMSFAEAVAPEGYSAADVSVGPQTLAELRQLAGDAVAEAAFEADADSLVGPVRSPFGWHVVAVGDVTTEQGVDEGVARAEAREEITAAKRRNALLDAIADIEDAVRDGESFAEVAERFELVASETPAITATGRDRTNADFRIPENLSPALEAGFAMAGGDDPEVVLLADNSSFVLVDVADIIDPAPAALDGIAQRVRADYIRTTAEARANELANEIIAAVREGSSLADAVSAVAESSGFALPAPESPELTRLELGQFGGQPPAPLAMLFRLSEGATRTVGDAEQRGVFVVELTEIERGNALSRPSLISQTAEAFAPTLEGELQQQFLAAIEREVGVTREPAAIEATRARIIGGGN
ncbi:peptidylprolyl isomerase [Sphingomicrobium aestuariivivum]|uniref:peptidylprolyl isomerase n=1 Tax=Sphingomicrobium aestuariivivum TaxID=1582356 RepID=UPI001FD63A3F|nr:peptidylprolyl isomerase [Sphingomicrobium aestuariivivum]MCJ8190074.1 SurA N-terminal domain-containing protein [Sphingomicrobium aestuariivivum]